MSATDLLRILRSKRLTVQVDGDRLLVSPADRITDEDRATIYEPTRPQCWWPWLNPRSRLSV